MKLRTELAICAMAMAPLLAVSCAATLGQSAAGAHVHDAITATRARAGLGDGRQVAAASLRVEDSRGGAMPSGFARSAQEHAAADALVREGAGAKSARDGVAVRP